MNPYRMRFVSLSANSDIWQETSYESFKLTHKTIVLSIRMKTRANSKLTF